jgi:predicted transcriptional regulator
MDGSDSETPRERVLFLARAQSRAGIVETLAATGSATQRQLRERLNASRTTVSRALQSLTDRGWVEEANGEYRLTRSGDHIAVAFDRLLDTVDRVDELDEFLRLFPADLTAPDFLDASDVSVTYATDAAPYAPARKQSEILHSAERLRILLPAVDLESTNALAEQVTDRGLDVETIVSQGVEAEIESDEFAPQVKTMIRAGGLSIRVANGGVPLYLGLADSGTVQIGLAGDDGLPRALFETTDERVREWAERLYSDVRERTTPKRLDDF